MTVWGLVEVLRGVVVGEPYGADGKKYAGEVRVGLVVVDIMEGKDTTVREEGGDEEGDKNRGGYIRVLTQDLVNVWNTLWSNSDARAKQYRVLLERIERVRVCVDGEAVRERGLSAELERGRKERARIDMRAGW